MGRGGEVGVRLEGGAQSRRVCAGGEYEGGEVGGGGVLRGGGGGGVVVCEGYEW